MSRPRLKKFHEETFKGWELVQATARLCAMNLLLREIQPWVDSNRQLPAG